MTKINIFNSHGEKKILVEKYLFIAILRAKILCANRWEKKVYDKFLDCGRSFEAEFGRTREADTKPRKILTTPRCQFHQH